MYAKKNLPELKFTDAEKTALQNYYEVWVMNYELWIMNYELWIMNYENH